MHKFVFTAQPIGKYEAWLRREERAQGTREKYLRDIRAFRSWLEGRAVDKEQVVAWKGHLLEQGYAPVTVNSMLASLHSFFRFAGWTGCQVKYVNIQRRLFRESQRELTRQDYQRLTDTAHQLGKTRLELLLESIAATGVRVSEVRYLTVEAAQRGRAEISLKGKIRVILLPGKLCRKMLKYAMKNHITTGEIFITRRGKSLSRRQIWAEMKALCEKAGVESSKVFPHNLRHLFATAFYQTSRDIVKLADVLGHSSIETTRIYLVTSGSEHAKALNQLGFVQ